MTITAEELAKDKKKRGSRWRPLEPLLERFWSNVRTTATCWLWTGSHDKYGYGYLNYGVRIHQAAHRFSYTVAFGPIPPGLFVCHRCDNPACVRPDHLFLGTRSENSKDMVRKGRHFQKPSHCRHGHEYTPENTYYERGRTTRYCKICKAKRRADWKRKAKGELEVPVNA